MDEYQFQHEEDPRLKEAVADAINRSLWRQRWDRTLADVRDTRIAFGSTIAFVFLINLLIISMPTGNLPISTTIVGWVYALILFGLLGLAVMMTGRRGGNKQGTLGIQEELAKPKHVVKVQKILFYGPMILCIVVHDPIWRIGLYLPLVLYTLGWDWQNLRKLRRNLIKWGVIEPDGSHRLSSNTPPVAHLKESEDRIDDMLGASPTITKNRFAERKNTT